MTLTERIYAQSLLLAGRLEPRQEMILQGFCAAAERKLRGRLRPDVTVEECGEDFVMAAALYALAMASEIRSTAEAESFSVGDISVTCRDGKSTAKSLTDQADRLLAPYMVDGFSFQGV